VINPRSLALAQTFFTGKIKAVALVTCDKKIILVFNRSSEQSTENGAQKPWV
jgi:hypothetical protein